MPRVEREGSVRIPSLVLNFRRELAKELPEPWVRAGSHILSGSRGVVRPAASSPAASSARAFKTSWDCANRWAHPSSDTISDWSHPAIRSCSSGGRDDIWLKTSASARVMHLGYRPGDCRTSRCSTRRQCKEIEQGLIRFQRAHEIRSAGGGCGDRDPVCGTG